jgi:ligand-binding SRPBCC domain-containing protein
MESVLIFFVEESLPSILEPLSTFRISFEKVNCITQRLRAQQILPHTREDAFAFFEDPRNLYSITPDWLDFRLVDSDQKTEVFEGAEYNYTIRWMGLPIKWRSRIVDYRPPDRFTDVQVRGPYRIWKHVHMFEKIPEGTWMKDEVTYRIQLGLLGLALNRGVIQKQLKDIFTYRAYTIDQKLHKGALLKGE